MQFAVCLAVILPALFNSVYGASLTCSSGQTLVHTGYLYEDKKCSELIGEITNYYKLEYRQECQRWLGLASLPASVSEARRPTAECFEFSNGTTAYRAEVCCDGQTTAQRCFTCPTRRFFSDPKPSEYNTLECDHQGTVVTCPAGQVCQTLFTYNKAGSYMAKMCAPQSQCEAAEAKNSETCVSYKLKEPSCTKCCSGPFCNYDNTVLHRQPFQCLCYNGGSCVDDPTDSRGYKCVCTTPYTGTTCSTHPCNSAPCKNRGQCYRMTSSPYYQCYCRPGWTGTTCTTAVAKCSKNICGNGGTCYNHGTFGVRCLCPDGYVGDVCEYKRPLTCHNPAQYTLLPYENMKFGTWKNCSELLDDRAKYLDYYIAKIYCRSNMGGGSSLPMQVFRDSKLITHTAHYCEHGEKALWYKSEVCCAACFSNPCQNDGLCMSTEGGNNYVCACQFGFEGRNCQNRISMCFASGDPHYKTFDGEMLHFQGKCKYNMVSPKSTATDMPDFKVYVRNEYRYGDTHTTYTKYVEVHLSGKKVVIGTEKKTTVDGVRVYPDAEFSGFRIVNNGRFVRLETDFGLAVESDGNWLTIVKVPATFGSRLEGLCADFDGSRRNDFTVRNGTDVSGNEYRHSLVGNSWKIDDAENPGCPSDPGTPPPVCTPDKQTLFSSSEYCGLITDKSGVFKGCLNDAAVWSLAPLYYENCMYDTCANQKDLKVAKEAACGSLEVLAADCASKGKIIDWRAAAGCPLTCPAGSNMVYKVRTSACIPTCANPTADKACGLPDTESCTCETGMLLWQERCVKPEECGCYYWGKYYKIGDDWLSETCSVKFSCVACETCAYPVGVVVNTTFSCPAGEICTRSRKVEFSFQCQQDDVDGKWSDWGPWNVCSAGSCSSGRETRSRACNNPAPSKGGETCPGDATESRACTCVDGEWGVWGPWSTCDTQSCVSGAETRSRACNNPKPANGGRDCPGASTESHPCHCPDAAWSAWGAWSTCSAGSCASGKETRSRACDNPPPSKGGPTCVGPATQSRPCRCVDGAWCAWSSWSTCAAGTCSSARQTRSRACTDPAPSNGGQSCSGETTQYRRCPCVDGAWGGWSSWSACSGSCDARTRSRQRSCDNPSPSDGGKNCAGQKSQSQACTCALGFNAAVDCAKCEDVVNGLGYLPNLCDCSSYYQCENIGGIWYAHSRKCANCTLWSQDDVSCSVRIPGCKANDDYEKIGPEIIGDTCVKDGMVRKKHSSSLKYIWVVGAAEYEMPCPPGTAFDFLNECECARIVPVLPVKPTPILCLPFNWGFAASKGWGWVGVYGVSITTRTGTDRCALFNGAGHLEIPRFTNYVPPNGITISFWYRRTGGSGEQGLVTNNCKEENSIEITSSSETTLFAKVKSVAADGSIHRGTVTVTSVSFNVWHYVVYSFDGKYLTVYVDKVKYVSAYTPGKLFNTQCTMIVGKIVTAVKSKYFTGNMDELCFYDGPTVLSASAA